MTLTIFRQGCQNFVRRVLKLNGGGRGREVTPSAVSSMSTTNASMASTAAAITLPGLQSKYEYDLIVIGGGSGGLAVSKEATQFGAKVALFDYVPESPQGTSWGVGGTCVNVGCIPKKMMHVAALVGENINHAHAYGWTNVSETTTPNWTTLVQNVQDRIKGTNFTYRVALRDKKVNYINALAEFVDAHTVKAKNKQGKVETYTADKFVIAVGGRPTYPTDVPGAKEYAITSDDIFSMFTPPGKVLIVGASYIALETAGFLAGLKVDVTVMVRSVLLRGFDKQMSELVGSYMSVESGVKFLRERVPTRIEEKKKGDSKGKGRVLLVKSKGTQDGKVYSEEYNTVLFAIGRHPVTDALQLGKAGVNIDENKKIICEDNDSTSVPNIYAIGDCVKNRPELTPAAIQAGLLLAKRLYGGSSLLTDYANCPTTIFTPMEYGCVGLSEDDAVAKYGGKSLEVYHSFFQPFESQLPQKDLNRGYCKVICRKNNGEVVGIHYLGPNAGEVIQGFAVAMRLGVKKNDLNATIGIHPTSAENFTIIMNITKSSGQDPMKKGCCG